MLITKRVLGNSSRVVSHSWAITGGETSVFKNQPGKIRAVGICMQSAENRKEKMPQYCRNKGSSRQIS
jgi:hypothetical protein